MELRHLRYFVAIAEEENFRRAADKLHVSQSPLSRQMQQLEEEISAELFEASGRGVRLTPAGRLFLEKAKAIIASVEAAAKEAKETAEGRIGTITIGFEGGSSLFDTLSTLISRFRKRAPRVNVELFPMSSAEQWAALDSHQILLGYGNRVPDKSSLQSIVLGRHRMGLIVPNDHRLASQRKIRVKELTNEPIFMDAKRQPSLARRYHRRCPRPGCEPQRDFGSPQRRGTHAARCEWLRLGLLDGVCVACPSNRWYAVETDQRHQGGGARDRDVATWQCGGSAAATVPRHRT